MNFEQLKLKINEILAVNFEIPQNKLIPEASLKSVLGLDSLDAVDMLVALEEELQLKVDGEKLKTVIHLRDVYNLVWDRLAPSQAEEISSAKLVSEI